MRKFIYLMVVLVVFLVGCSAGELSISELESIPKKVNEVMDLEEELQLISEGEDIKYILYKSDQKVTGELELDGDMLKILLTNGEDLPSGEKQYLFKVTDGDAEYESILAVIDGIEKPFNRVTGF